MILNPHAQSGRAEKRRGELEALFRAAGLDAEFRLTTAPGEATTLVSGLPKGTFDVVVSAGGDGTLFEVVNGLMARPEAHRESLGVLPLGTGNAFARDLGLAPGDVEAGMDLLMAGEARPVDVAEVETTGETFHFINIIGAGFVVHAGRLAQRLKWTGRMAYTLGALAALVRMPRFPLEIEIDGERVVQDCFFVEVSNSRYTGTRFLMAPEAEIDDGFLDVTLVRRLPRHRALRLFPTIYDGRHVHAPEVSVYRARQVRLLGPAGLECAVDGEFRGHLPLELRCLNQALQVIGAWR